MATATTAQHTRADVLICTLGGTPRIVTFALDWLRQYRAHQISIRQVVVVYVADAGQRSTAAVQTLRKALKAYVNPALRFDAEIVREMHAIRSGNETHMLKGLPISDKSDARFADAVWLTLHDLIYSKKRDGLNIQLCLAGGPRLMSLQALSAASLLFTNRDQCWHMYTPDALQTEANAHDIMHIADFDDAFAASAADFRLIEVPIVPMGRMFPALQAAALMTPAQIIQQHSNRIDDEEQRKCRAVYAKLTPRQRAVLREFAQGALTINDVAQRLCVSSNTIGSHNREILAVCRVAWGLADDYSLSHSFMCEKFGDLPTSFWDDLASAPAR